MTNFWNWLLSGVIWIITHLVLPLFGLDVSQGSSAITFLSTIGNGVVIVFQLAYISLSTFNLMAFGIWLTTFLMFAVLRIVLGIWLFIKSLLPDIAGFGGGGT